MSVSAHKLTSKVCLPNDFLLFTDKVRSEFEKRYHAWGKEFLENYNWATSNRLRMLVNSKNKVFRFDTFAIILWVITQLYIWAITCQLTFRSSTLFNFFYRSHQSSTSQLDRVWKLEVCIMKGDFLQSYTANLSKNEFELHFDVTSFGMFWAIQDIIENRYLTMNAFLVTIGLTSVFIVFADFWRYPMSFSVGENADSPPNKSKMGEGAAVNSVASTALPDVLPAGEKHTPGSSKKNLTFTLYFCTKFSFLLPTYKPSI